MASRSLGTLTIDLVARTLGFTNGMDKAARDTERQMKRIEAAARRFGTVAGAGIAAGIGIAGAALTKLTSDAIDYADQLDELSNRLGISTEQLSAWGYAAKLTGSDLDALASTIPKLSKNLASAMDEGSKQAELFRALGIEVTDAAGNLRDVEDVLPEIADRFKQLDNDTTEAALAMELFGKSGAEFLEFLNLGSDGLAKMAGEAQELGAVVDGETAAAAAQFKDELDRLSAATLGLGTQIAAQLLPVVVDLVGDMREWVQQGDLARNITTLITAAVNIGAGAIDAYNNAVDRTSIAIETAVETAAGWLEIQKQISTLGFAEGSISGGWERIKNAFTKGQDELDDLVARQNAPRISAPVPGVDEIDFTRGAPTSPGEASGLDQRLNRYLRDEDGKKKAAKATKELTDAEKALQEVMEVNALIDEQVQGYRSQQIQDAYELEKAREAAVKRVDDQIADMQFEYDLIGKTNRERAKEIELRYAGADATEEQRKKIAALAGEIYDENRAMEKQIDVLDTSRDAFTGLLGDLREGVKPLDALWNALDRLIDKFSEIAFEAISDQLFGQRGDSGGGGWGNAIGNALGMFFGGGRASGGWAMPNTVYEVNERGLEMATVRGRDYMLTGDQPVHITPNSQLGGGGGVSQVNNFAFAAPTSPNTQAQVASRVGYQLRRSQRFGQ